MIDIKKQIAYWRDSSLEDWQVSQELVASGRIRHGLFFSHLALEKLLKAIVCQRTQDLAPRLHNLVRLAEIAKLSMEQEQIDLLAETNAFNIEGRYPEQPIPTLSPKEAKRYLQRVERTLQWLMQQL